MPCLTLCAELDPSAAYMEWVVRGSCWKDEKACGDAGPVGKKLAMGDEGGEGYKEDMMLRMRLGMMGNRSWGRGTQPEVWSERSTHAQARLRRFVVNVNVNVKRERGECSYTSTQW